MLRLIISVLSILVACQSFGAQARRPNVVILAGDDHQNDILGAYGSKLAHTPNLDRLAEAGIRFDRAYCNSPMCTSSRQSFLTGRYAHAVGVTMLPHVLDDEAYTLAERLAEAGYRTGVFGKTHFNSSLSHGFEKVMGSKRWARFLRQHRLLPVPEGVEVLPPWRPFKDHARIWLNGFYRPYKLYDGVMHDTWSALQAIKFMKAHKDEPFFVQVGFQAPHSPFRFPIELRNRYNPKDMPVPMIGPEDVPQIPKIFADLTMADKQGIVASYYTAVEFLDNNVGRVLAALDKLGLADNTLVIYLGDNGYHLGQHGRFEKHCFYERAVRVPLIMRLPGRISSSGSTKALVEFVDIVPTVLDYLGLSVDRDQPAPRDLHGFSLRPLIESKVSKVRDAVFSEYQPTTLAMVRTENYKLIYRTSKVAVDWLGYEPIMPPTGREILLYDLQADPEEIHNIAGDPAHAAIVNALLDRLADWYRRIPPRGDKPPSDQLSREEFLDWAIAPRNVGKAHAKTKPAKKN